MDAKLSLVLAETAIEAVMAKGAVVLYNQHLKPKVAPHCVNMTLDEVSKLSLVILVLLIFLDERTFAKKNRRKKLDWEKQLE